jgi:hypothetical protein
MGRKHKHRSLKYIKQNLMRENENLKIVNESLQIMSNNATTRNIESRKEVVELENRNHAIMKIVEMQKEANDFLQQKNEVLETQLSLFNNPERNSSFGSTLMLACSVKINNIKSEECVGDEGDKIKICEDKEDEDR